MFEGKAVCKKNTGSALRGQVGAMEVAVIYVFRLYDTALVSHRCPADVRRGTMRCCC